jgi:hypothetical protein
VDDDKRKAALAWAARGFRVFPLQPGTKVPVSEGWTDYATADAGLVHAMWTDPVMGTPKNFNIGVLTDNMIVSDLDMKDGKNGVASYQALGLATETLRVATPSGGFHLYFSGPNKSLSAGRLGEGIDIRSYHGYVVGPGSFLDGSIPSNKGSHGYYTVEHDAPVAQAEAALIARLDEPMERQSREAVVDLDSPAAVIRAISWLDNEAPLALEGDAGDHTTFKVCAHLKDIGLSETTALQVLWEHWNQRCSPPWSPEELARKVQNAFAYGSLAPGASSAAAMVAGLSLPALPSPALAAPPQKREWFTHGDTWNLNVPWLFYETLPAHGLALLTGQSNTGKTFLAIEMARCLATGATLFGVQPDDRGATVFLFAGTEGSGFAQRLAALGEKTPLPISATQVGMVRERGALEMLEADIRNRAAEMELIWGLPLRLVVLDTLSASGLLEDENNNAQAALAMVQLSNLGMKLGVLMLVTHHPAKDGKGERGAGAIRNSSDYCIEITREGTQALRQVELTKARNAQQRSLGAYTLNEVVLGQDARGRAVRSMVLAQSVEAPKATRKPPAFADMFMTCLDLVMGDPSELVTIEGRTMVEVEAVKAVFKERKPGDRDRSNIARIFKAAVEWHCDLGIVARVEQEGRTYLAPAMA